MILERLVVSPFATNCFVVGCSDTREAMVIDPGDDADSIMDAAREHGLTVKAIVLTHGHVDHVCAAGAVKEQTGAEILMHAADAPQIEYGREMAAMFGWFVAKVAPADRTVAEGDTVKVGNLAFSVLHTPGHSPGGITLVGEGRAFVGDLIFEDSVGRTDLPGGSHERLLKSVIDKIFVLPDSTILHTGHGGDTTVGREKASNPFFLGC